jgi:hypothetical protein
MDLGHMISRKSAGASQLKKSRIEGIYVFEAGVDSFS